MFLVWPFFLPEVCPSSDLTLLLGTILLLGAEVEVVAVVKADLWMM